MNSHPFECVYVLCVLTMERVKIGYTTNLKKRISALQTSNPDELIFLGAFPGTPKDEQRIKHQFRHLRIRGEWFRTDMELGLFIVDHICTEETASFLGVFFSELAEGTKELRRRIEWGLTIAEFWRGFEDYAQTYFSQGGEE